VQLISDIIDFWTRAGWYVLPLLLLSIFSWIWLLNLYFKLRLCYFRTSFFEEEIERRLASGESRSSVLNWLSSERGIIARIINYVFLFANKSGESIRDRFYEACGDEINTIEKEFVLLGSMVKAAPLLGLLGTVVGMIDTFAALGTSSGMETVSLGISKALLTTQLGLLIALPGIFGLVYLKRKFNRFTLELDRLELHLEHLIQREVA
jgi:biopolymer transport protein ExbB